MTIMGLIKKQKEKRSLDVIGTIFLFNKELILLLFNTESRQAKKSELCDTGGGRRFTLIFCWESRGDGYGSKIAALAAAAWGSRWGC